MDLKFLGRGSAFNVLEGNTSCYFIEKDELFLIDCGENVFNCLIKKKLLDKVKCVNLFITHTHSDHIGSVGSLSAYLYYSMQIPLNVIYKDNTHKKVIERVFSAFGSNLEHIVFIKYNYFDNKYTCFNNIRYIATRHCDNMHCYGIKFNCNSGVIYYSGDSCDTKNIEDIIKINKKIDKIYVDVTSLDYKNNTHLYIGMLAKVIPFYLKDKIYCMHINNNDCIDLINKLGFKVVSLDD